MFCEPWFVANDVCRILGYGNPREAVRKHVEDDEKDYVTIRDAMSRHRKTTIISEPGLYGLIFGSKRPEAKKLKRWVPTRIRTREYRLES